MTELPAPAGPRERLLAAMIEVCSEDGYGGASVARVIAHAGVSRRTFYAHFGCREECFAATYRATLARARDAATVAGRCDPRERPRPLLDALLRAIAADPATARLALLEVHAAPAAVRAEHDGAVRQLERDAARCLGGDPERRAMPDAPIAALRGGIESVVAIRLLRDEAHSLPDLADELVAWIDSYRPPAGAAATPSREWERWSSRFLARIGRVDSRPSLLPRGRQALPPAIAARERRGRIVEATIRVAALRGYSAVTVGEIAAAARVTKAAFYSHFDSKQAAFLAAERLRLQESLAAAAAAFYAEDKWLDRVWAGLGGLLRYLAENPHTAITGFREVHAAGEEAIRLDHDSRNAFTLFLEEGNRQRIAAGRPLPQIAAEAIAGANHELIRRQIVSGGPAGVPKLLPQLTYVTVVPFVGHEVAGAFIEDRVEGVRREARGTAAASP